MIGRADRMILNHHALLFPVFGTLLALDQIFETARTLGCIRSNRAVAIDAQDDRRTFKNTAVAAFGAGRQLLQRRSAVWAQVRPGRTAARTETLSLAVRSLPYHDRFRMLSTECNAARTEIALFFHGRLRSCFRLRFLAGFDTTFKNTRTLRTLAAALIDDLRTERTNYLTGDDQGLDAHF